VLRNDTSGPQRWIRVVTQLLVPAFTAVGVSFGALQADLANIATIREEFRAHERVDAAVHAELTRLLGIDTGGFSDPRMVYAVAEQIKRGIEHLQTRADAKRWRAAFKQLNRDLVLPDGE
jgi:hypothetical protein